MFLESSRYFRQKTVEVPAPDGRVRKAVKLRKLPPTRGNLYTVKADDRLDIIANRQYKQPTWFWHIADANTEMEANELVSETNREIYLPEI